ncbi:MAG TPA: histidine kinase dimerization/phospho-acceptor domain-containing protein [Thermoanaerobaculia bacterium]|nr:histidine kinase dimerization/phospho-acceptor domain-containing protein [Thermoanaerobaculia bacterium]
MSDTEATPEKKPTALELRTARMESLAALAGGVTHELNNLLATVLMSVELLGKALREPSDQRVLASLEEITRRGLHVIRQLLYLARGVEGEPALYQLSYLIIDLQKLARAAFPRSIELVTDYPADLWLLHGDPLVASQLLLALLLEAREELQGSGILRLAAHNERLDATRTALPDGIQPGPHVVLEVTAAAAADDYEPGGVAGPAGLPGAPSDRSGLSVLGGGHRTSPQAAIVACGGFSEPCAVPPAHGRRVYLPAVAPPPPRQEAVPAEARRGAGELVLIVEEEAALAGMLGTALERHGYRALTLPFPLPPDAVSDPRLHEVSLIVTSQAAAHAAALLKTAVHAAAALKEAAQAAAALKQQRALPEPGQRGQRELSMLVLAAPEPGPGLAACNPPGRTLRKPFTTRQLLAAVAGALG